MGSSRIVRRALTVALALLALTSTTVVVTRRAEATPRRLRVYPLGDSITYGTTAVWSSVPGGYRDTLDADLSTRGLAHLFVGSSSLNPSPRLAADGEGAHDGHPGWRIDQVASGLGGWMAAGLRPDIVVVHLGTNDILQRHDPGRPVGDGGYADTAVRAAFVADLAVRLDGLVAELEALAPRATVVVSTVIPLATGTDADLVPADVAGAVRMLVARRMGLGERVRLADAYGAFAAAGPGLLSFDGVHPSAAGYAVLGHVLAAAIAAT